MSYQRISERRRPTGADHNKMQVSPGAGGGGGFREDMPQEACLSYISDSRKLEYGFVEQSNRTVLQEAEKENSTSLEECPSLPVT